MEKIPYNIKIKKGYLALLILFALFVFSNFYLLDKITDTNASNQNIEKVGGFESNKSNLFSGIKEDLKDSLKNRFYVNKPNMTIEDFKKEVIRIIDIFVK